MDYFAFINKRKFITSGEIIPNKPLFMFGIVLTIAAVIIAFLTLDGNFSGNYFAQYPIIRFLMEWTTNIGEADWMLVVSGSVLLFMSFQNPTLWPRIQRLQWHHTFLKVYFVFSTIVFSGLIALLFKNAIGRARPRILEGDTTWTSVPFGDTYDFASFPSGHSTSIAALAMAIALIYPKLRYLMLALALWVGSSRAVVGVHYPSDILAGLAFGAVFTWVYARIFAKRRLLFQFGLNNELNLRPASGDNLQKPQYSAFDTDNCDSKNKPKLRTSSNP